MRTHNTTTKTPQYLLCTKHKRSEKRAVRCDVIGVICVYTVHTHLHHRLTNVALHFYKNVRLFLSLAFADIYFIVIIINIDNIANINSKHSTTFYNYHHQTARVLQWNSSSSSSLEYQCCRQVCFCTLLFKVATHGRRDIGDPLRNGKAYREEETIWCLCGF